VDLGAAEHTIRRRQLLQLALRVILADAGDGAELVKAVLVGEPVDALTNGEPALVALSLDLLNASHLARERFAPGEVVELRLPHHSCPPSSSCCCCAPARRSIFAPAGWQKYRRRLRAARRRRQQGPASAAPLPCAPAFRHTSPTTGRSSPRHRSGTAATTAAPRTPRYTSASGGSR